MCEGKELRHIKPGFAVHVGKVKAPPLLQVELLGVNVSVEVLQIMQAVFHVLIDKKMKADLRV